ncbi:MAG: hypothetical protein JWQ71_3677 [Pedosphaera sp.]|nr:hypothetical protein [Pedosphaera sp.]
MVHSFRIITAALPLLLWGRTLAAQEKPITPAPTANVSTPQLAPLMVTTSPGLLNDWLRDQSTVLQPWDLGGQLRARLEHKEYFATPSQPGAVDFRKTGGNADNTYLLLREKIHLGYFQDWFGAYVEARDSSSTGDERNPNLESDTFDLHQAFLRLCNPSKFPLVAKVGRQELIYGDERLIGPSDWNNIGRVFDAAKLRYEIPGFWVDAFVSRVVIPDDNNFNVSNEYDTFSGIYGSTSVLIPKQETQLYFLARNTENGSPNLQTGALVPLPSPRDIYTVGFRMKSLPKQLHGWDYTAEAAFQFGRFGTVSGTAPKAIVGKSLHQEAYAIHLDGGYTWEHAFGTPRLAVEYNYASGDSNPKDGTHSTFDTLFPSTHKFSGIMDLFSWQNMQDVGLFASIKPLPKLTLITSYRAFWLADTADAFYQGNGTPRTGGTTGGHNGYALNPNYGSYVGSEVDLLANYAIMPYASAEAAFGHFFGGDYVRQSLSKFGSADANYIYLQTNLKF